MRRKANRMAKSAADELEKNLRKKWTNDGISKEKQDAIINDITKKSQTGAQIGPFFIGGGNEVIIEIRGGFVQAVYSNVDIKVDVLDHDNASREERNSYKLLADRTKKMRQIY